MGGLELGGGGARGRWPKLYQWSLLRTPLSKLQSFNRPPGVGGAPAKELMRAGRALLAGRLFFARVVGFF